MIPADELTLALAALREGLVDEVGLADLAFSLGASSGGTTIERLLHRRGIPAETIARLRASLDKHTLGYEEHPAMAATVPPVVSAGDGEWRALLAIGQDAARFAERYTVGEELGRGGVGRVLIAEDRLMGRAVAVKTLHEGRAHEVNVRRFFAEAQTTAQLEHPNVVPVYDMGSLPDGEPFFSMKWVRGRELSRLVGAHDGVDRQARYRLLQIFTQVCMAVDYAHAKGVVHRDLKPDNVMVGDFGEVLVMDWGVAKTHVVTSTGSDAVETSVDVSLGEGDGRPMTVEGAVVGTPGYMPPEQAMGDIDSIDARSDVWALGAILYEMLTGQRTFTGGSAFSVLIATVSEDLVPPSERAPEREIPGDLEEICLRALRKEQAERYPSARALYDDVERYLAGTRERERLQAQADELVGDGEESLWFRRMVGEELEELRARLAALPPLSGQEPIDEKRARWEIETRHEEVLAAQLAAFASAESKFLRATELVPRHQDAVRHLSDMHWQRYREARAANDHRDATEHLKVVGRYAARGTARLATQVPLTLVTDPPGANVVLYRYVERDRVLVPTVARPLGATPLDGERVPTGRQLIELSVPGRPTVRLPVMVWQGDRLHFEVRLPTAAELGDDFVFVPGGPYMRGNDRGALLAAEPGEVDVGPYAIGRYPVTCEAYFAFLNTLGPDDALARAPRESGVPVVLPDDDDVYRLPVVDKDGDEWQADWPVQCVSYEDASAYAQWYGARFGARCRLPTEDEWEKAARGTDGRIFPWGDHFEPSFCAARGSVPGDDMPKPVGLFETDASPYGVRDLAGGVREWTSGWFEPNELRTIRGGAFNHYAFLCRSASRYGAHPRRTQWAIGFRLVKAL